LRLRSKGRWWRSWIEWFERQPRAPTDRPDENLEVDEWRSTLWSAVGELPEPQKQAVLLRYAEDLSYEQIAAVLHCPVGTVKSRLHHGLAALQRKLGKFNDSEALAMITGR
jgi:RNA polymerase sigma-70 factor (ECF subfamily)